MGQELQGGCRSLSMVPPQGSLCARRLLSVHRLTGACKSSLNAVDRFLELWRNDV